MDDLYINVLGKDNCDCDATDLCSNKARFSKKFPKSKLMGFSMIIEQLSGVTIIIIMGGGALTFFILFVFAKRQIMRFALRFRHGPHNPIGLGANKKLRKEIERRIDLIPKIVHEPRLINGCSHGSSPLSLHYYRYKAVDDIKFLENEIKQQDSTLVRHPNENLRAFLISTLSGLTVRTDQRQIHKFCDMYDHAKHDPTPFQAKEYEQFQKLLIQLIEASKLLKNCSSKTSPCRTPQKAKLPRSRISATSASQQRAQVSNTVTDEVLTCAGDQTDNRPSTLSITKDHPLSNTETPV